MATSSFLSEVRIEDEQDAKRLIKAIETAEEDKDRKVSSEKPYSDVTRDEIQLLFN